MFVELFFFFSLVGDGSPDVLHEFLLVHGASGVDGLALLDSTIAAQKSGQVEFNGVQSQVNGVHLSEGAGDEEFIVLQINEGLTGS